MTEEPIFVMCNCTGECPGFQKLDLWKFINRVRNEMNVDFAIVHPQLCDDDGERFWKYFGKPGQKYIVGGCDPRMQRKMYRDVLENVGVDFDSQITALDLRSMETDQVIEKVNQAITKKAK